MCVGPYPFYYNFLFDIAISIYVVHEDAKDKEFELEISWIGPESKNLHVHVPKDLFAEAEAKAKEAVETFDEEET